MKHLKLVSSGIDVRPFLDELTAHAEQWHVDTSRQEKISVQRETRAITLRAHAEQASEDSRVRRAKPFAYRGHPSAMAAHFPYSSTYVDQLARGMDGTIGRAVITTLTPGGTIYPHADAGLYWLLRDRYHLVLKSAKGSYFKVGGEEVRMQEGELWWFDHTAIHEGTNDSDEDRIHIIVDVLSPHSMKTFRQRLLRAPVQSLVAFFKAGVRRLAWPIRQSFPSSPAKT